MWGFPHFMTMAWVFLQEELQQWFNLSDFHSDMKPQPQDEKHRAHVHVCTMRRRSGLRQQEKITK